MRSIKNVHRAISAPISDLITFRAMPTNTVDHIDPFLFLNHHGPQQYGPNNRGLPFGPHPHRGFETLTFVLEGDIMHWDSSGSKSVISAGGIQWMTAGSGLIHSEISSEEFKKNGGRVELLQLWMNLAAKHKMVNPSYVGLSKDEIPKIKEDRGKVTVNLISGNWREKKGLVNSLSNLMLCWIELSAGGKFKIDVSEENNIFFYVVRGELIVNGTEAKMHHLVEFENDDTAVDVSSTADSIILFGHGKPFNEPIVAQGPFVMNSEEELRQAYMDYQAGKMGTWNN